MKWLTKLSSYRTDRQPITDEFPKFWDESRISIYKFLCSQPLGTDQSQVTLPDEKPADGTLRFAAGAMDGAFGHHGSAGKESAQEVFSALQRACKTLNNANLKSLYDLILQEGKALGVADSLVRLLATYPTVNAANLLRIALWLAKCSPDREPVKFGAILLGCLNTPEPPIDVLITLGRHDEFTLYSVVALGKQLSGSEQERVLWQLAKEVHGWGRIHIVERLAETADPEIKAWMLRDGYKNAVMYEYLAYTCATTGGLVEALRVEEPDEALLIGARDILQSLIYGGPAEDMSDYTDGVEAIQLFMGHIARNPLVRLTDLLTISSIKYFVEAEEQDWEKLEKNGWSSDIRKKLASTADTLLARPEWLPLVNDALHDTADNSDFWVASQAAKIVGVDPWENHFERQKSEKSNHQWYFLMQTQDRDRAARVVELAEQQLSLSMIARGPALDIGHGPDFADHFALDFVLQDLERFPGLGWPLVATGLKSPVIRNRHMALKVLEGWPRDVWPAQALPALKAALEIEPDGDVEKRMAEVIAGRTTDG